MVGLQQSPGLHRSHLVGLMVMLRLLPAACITILQQVAKDSKQLYGHLPAQTGGSPPPQQCTPWLLVGSSTVCSQKFKAA